MNNNEDIYEAFASAAQENYNSGSGSNRRSTNQNGTQSQTLGLFNFTSSSANKTPTKNIDMEEVPQIKIKKSFSRDQDDISDKEEIKQSSTRQSSSMGLLDDEEEEKKPASNNSTSSFMPSISLERRQAVQNFTERIFNQTTQQAILDNANNARDSIQQRLRTPINFVSNKMQVSRETQRRGMWGGFIMTAFFMLFAIQSLPLIIFSPQNFNSYFSLGMLSLLFALFMRRQLNAQPETSSDGLSRYIPSSMLDTRDTLATTFLLASISGSIYFSAVDPSYLLSLLFCFLQMNAVLFYFFGVVYTPGSQSGSELLSNARSSLGTLRDRVQTTIAGQAIQTGYTRMVNGINERITGNNNRGSSQNNRGEDQENNGGTVLREQPRKDNNGQQ